MAKNTSTQTAYAVARGEKVLSRGFATIEGARVEMENYVSHMQQVGLEPDVRLVEYDETTTVERSRPRAYREPTADTTRDDVDDTAGDTADSTDSTPGASK